MVKEFSYKGLRMDELLKLDIKEFSKLVPARRRRSLLRGFNEQQKALLKKIQLAKDGKYKKNIRTHARETVVLPVMVGQTVYIHNGKEFVPLIITEEMLGKYLGEFSMTRRKVEHSAPGLGATKSSAAITAK